MIDFTKILVVIISLALVACASIQTQEALNELPFHRIELQQSTR